MSRVRILLVALIAAASLVLSTVPAGASGKHAPKNVKKAANTLASFYAALGSGDLSGLKSSANLSGALGTYFAYVGTHC